MSGELSFVSGIDNAKMRMDARETQNLISGVGNTAQAESAKMENSFSGAGKAFALIGGSAAIAMLGKEILDTTAKFEKFGIVLRNTLGDTKGDAALNMIANFAATTPFQLDEVTAAFIKMANQGFVPTQGEMVKLGDLASTTGKSFDQLTEALLDAQTGQFERLKEFGIKASAQGDKVTFSFREQKTTVDNTNSAIQKYILSLGELKGVAGSNALISASLTGELSNLEDKFSMMFNTIGSANKGVLYEGVGMVTSLIDNYEIVGKTILGLVAIYGSYKAAVIVANAVSVIQKEIAVQQMLANIGNTGATISLTTAEGIEAVVKSQLTKAQLALNASMLANPYVMATVAVVALGVGIYALSQNLSDAQKAHEKLNETSKNMETSVRGEVIQVDTLFARLKAAKKGTDEYASAKGAIMSQYGQYLKGLGNETTALNNVALAQRTITEEIMKTARARAMTTATADASNNLATTQGDISEKMKKLIDQKFGKDSKQSLELFAKLKGVIQQGGHVSESFGKLFDETVYQQQGQFGGTTTYVDNELKNLLTKAKQAKALFSEIQKDAEVKFGSATTKDEVKDKPVVSETPAQAKAREAAERKAANAAARAEKEVQKINDAKLKLIEYSANAEFKAEQAKIDNQNTIISMQEDGFAKQLAVLNNQHEQSKLDIKKRAQELLKTKLEAEKETWKSNGSKGVFTPSTTDISGLGANEKTEIAYTLKLSDDKFESDKAILVKSLSEAYQSFDEKRKAIDEKYNREEADLNLAFTGDTLSVKLNELGKQRKSAIEANDKDEADSILKNTDLFVQLFGTMSDKSIEDIRKIASESQELFDYLKATSIQDITPHFGLSADELISLKLGKSEMKSIEDQIKTLNNTADGLETGFAKIGTAFKNVFAGSKQKATGKKNVSDGQALIDSGDPTMSVLGANLKGIGNQDQLDGLAKEKKGIDALQSSFQTVSYFAGQATSLLNAISTEEGDAASSAAKSIGAVMDVANSTMEGFKQGGVIGAGIALTVSVATKIFSAEKAHQAALKKIADEKTAQQKAYNDLLMKQNDLLEKSVTIFGTDSYAQAQGYAQVADKYRNASNNATADLSGAKVQTGSHKTGLFGWGGEKADYSSLLSQYPELIDSQGKLNQELAQTVLSNQTLDDASKKALQSALDYSKDYEDALKSLNDYLTSVFGSLGQDMMTSITDNLDSSQNALDAFGSSAAKTIEKLLSDIAYSLYMADDFTQLQNDVKKVMTDKSLTPEEQAAEQTKLMGDFYAGIGTDVTAANKFLLDSKAAAANAGLTLWDNVATREASKKGIATASQESVDENNGRLTSMNGLLVSIDEGINILKTTSGSILANVILIKGDTANLGDIKSDMASVKQGIIDINTKGILIKVN